MFVFMKLPDDLDAPPGSDAAAMACFRVFNDAYDDHASDKEAYLHQPDSEEDAAECLSFVDGRSDPAKIVQVAESWNRTASDTFNAVLTQLHDNAPKRPDGTIEWLGAPSPMIYSMKKAAMALDGQVHDFADYALLVTKYGYPTALFQPDELQAVQDDPSSYATLEVWPK